MDEGWDELDLRISERIQHLNATRAWPWQQPGVVSVGLDDDGRIIRYLATDVGTVMLGSVEP